MIFKMFAIPPGNSYPPLASASSMMVFESIYGACILGAFVALVWNYFDSLPQEIKHVWRVRPSRITVPFLLHRYASLVCAFVLVGMYVSWRWGEHGEWACGMTRWWPWACSAILGLAHLVMIIQCSTLYSHRKSVFFPLCGLAMLDLGLELFGNMHVKAIYLRADEVSNLRACFLMPTSAWFLPALIAPTVLHHVLLALTLFKTISHVREIQGVLVSRVLSTLQSHHIFFTLAICLVNFTSLVLVLQPSPFPYKLINYFPSLVFTQIFLGKIIFGLKEVAETSRIRNQLGHGVLQLELQLNTDRDSYPTDAPGTQWRRPSRVKIPGFFRRGSSAVEGEFKGVEGAEPPQINGRELRNIRPVSPRVGYDRQRWDERESTRSATERVLDYHGISPCFIQPPLARSTNQPDFISELPTFDPSYRFPSLPPPDFTHPNPSYWQQISQPGITCLSPNPHKSLFQPIKERCSHPNHPMITHQLSLKLAEDEHLNQRGSCTRFSVYAHIGTPRMSSDNPLGWEDSQGSMSMGVGSIVSCASTDWQAPDEWETEAGLARAASLRDQRMSMQRGVVGVSTSSGEA